MKSKRWSRRSFLESSARVAGGVGVLRSVSGRAVRAEPGPVLRWGIVGVGNRSRAHIEAFNQLERCRVVALCDLRPEALEEGAARVQGPPPRPFTQYPRMLEWEEVDAVCIVTPNYLHKEMTLQALSAGKHVLCEKPMGLTLEECEEVAAAARASDRVLQYGMQLRHAPLYRKVHELVQGGAIGHIRYAWISDFRRDIRQLYQDPLLERTRNWRYFQHLTGGMLLEYSIHRLDLLNWWMNARPVRVAAMGGLNVWRDRETIDHCGVLLEYASGARATYGMSLYSSGYRAPWLLIGDEGQLLVGSDRLVRQTGDVSNSLGPPRQPDREEVWEVDDPEDGTKLQYLHFLKAVDGKVMPYPDWRIAYAAMRVGIQGERAMQEEKVIRL